MEWFSGHFGERVMDFRYRGLPAARFAHLFGLADSELIARGMRRMIVDEKPGFPCRVTLEDAGPGERVLLLAFEHQPAQSPYRASGPIFVREGDHPTFDRVSEPPEVFRGRPLSVRAYAAYGMMVDADVTDGAQVERMLARLFERTDTNYVHVHFARRGCYAARVERA
jgi:hypothetical protein